MVGGQDNRLIRFRVCHVRQSHQKEEVHQTSQDLEDP